jgi:hypothetical protein
MYSLPPLTIENVPLRPDADDRLEFCERHESYFDADFEISITYDGVIWKITRISMVAHDYTFVKDAEGNAKFQRKWKRSTDITGRLFDEAVETFRRSHLDLIDDHLAEHLAGARDQAAFDALPAYKVAPRTPAHHEMEVA